MLKIYINNEEVVANQNFTIQKHMLNTPSVILNNVCPKSWCENKDYSNFYHPQDYSKCKIQDETYIPAEPGIYTTITGSATIQNVDTSKLQEVIQLDGDTTQSGTPTPTSPQPINVVSGRQDIDILGKNLFNPTYTFDGNGVEATINNQEITFNGTATSGGAYKMADITMPSGTYTISLEVVSGTHTNIKNIWFDFYNGNTKIDNGRLKTTGNFTKTFNTNINRINLGFDNRDVLDNFTFKVQIESGSSPSSWEAYEEQSYEINLGKNLINYSATGTGQDIDYNFNGSELSLNGTTSGSGQIAITSSQPITLEAGTYTFSNNTSGTFTANGKSTAIYLRKLSDNTGIITLAQNNNYTLTSTFTLTETTKVYVQIYTNGAGFVFDNFNIKWQIEKGGVQTVYTPYKTPIELCKIGDYKDRIFKNTTDTNLEIGKWYIEKNIGKVVLNGTEEGWNVRQGSNPNLYVYYLRNNAVADGKKESGGFSNYFIENTTSGLIQYDGGFRITEYNAVNIVFLCVNSSIATTIVNFKTWLSTHNTIIYYPLATPTYTQITDSELLGQLESLRLLEGLNNISITSGDLPGEIAIHYNYQIEHTDIDLLFCGVVKNSGNISLNPREPHYSTLQILDFKDFLSTGETLDYVIYQKTILEAIQQVIGTISDYGFVLGNVNILNQDDIIGAYSTKDKTAYDVFNYIADITQSRWTTRLVDENTVAIDFYDPTLMPEGTAINYTQNFFEHNLIDDMKYSYGTNNYRNKQVMVSNQVVGSLAQIQTLYSNGYQDQYIVDLPVAEIQNIYVNGEEKTYASMQEYELGINADFYYTVNSNIIESENILEAGDKIEIYYIPVIEGRQVITNNDEIERVANATGRKGIIARYENRNDATTSLELQKIGESYIKYKGTPEIKLTIQSRKNIWEVGENVNFNAPIDELDTHYMVRTKKINYIYNSQDTNFPVGQLFYTYELISSFNSETEINYFDNQRAKTIGNIGEGEYISRNIDIENTANIIFYDTTATEITITGDNELNAILNSPFIS